MRGIHLKNMTEEEREQARIKGSEAREAKKLLAKDYKQDFSDKPFWSFLASLYRVKLPPYYIHCSERKTLSRLVKKVEETLQERGHSVPNTWEGFMKSLGYNQSVQTEQGQERRSFKTYALHNPDHPMYALAGLYLEYIHYDVLGNKV